ncbi:MAG: lytic transglycosylase domain-containing protein [Pararhodobacter sp.]
MTLQLPRIQAAFGIAIVASLAAEAAADSHPHAFRGGMDGGDGAALVLASAPGQSLFPVPRPSRTALAAPSRAAAMATTTGASAVAVPSLPAAISAPPPRAAGALGALSQAIEAGDAGAVRTFTALAGHTGARIALWRALRAGEATTLQSYADFLAGHDHWPLTNQIHRQAESLLDAAPAPVVLEWFAAREPVSAEGALALIRALEASGDTARAQANARAVWRSQTLTEAQEATLLARHGDALRDLHAERLDEMLWRGATANATRMLERVPAGQAALARARLALQSGADGVNALINAVPAALANDPGLAHDRFVWRMRAGNLDSAAELLAERSRDPQSLGRPESWALARERLVRRANNEGQYRLAYELASRHGLDDGLRFITLEWLAGHIALRRLNDPQTALRHFSVLGDRVSSPISLSRGAWWEAQAQDALGNTDAAREALARAAVHQTAFYGLLAAERLGQPLDDALINPPAYPDWQQTALAQSDLLEAAFMLHAAGEWHEARRFIMHLATMLGDDEPALGALADLWLERGEPNFAVNVAKIAVQSGVVLPRANFPLTGLERLSLPAPADLVMAIARRESEFDAAVISHADARGLLQVLPSTGALTARRLGVAFDAARLTTDPGFNALLGAGYLAQMADQFDGALPLIAAAYNAGPGRPRRWITEFGDPRDPSVDPIEWAERIPFAETRNYVQRVLETLVIYRAMLSGDPAIRLGDMLRGRG